jgi:hypothetical protein
LIKFPEHFLKDVFIVYYTMGTNITQPLSDQDPSGAVSPDRATIEKILGLRNPDQWDVCEVPQRRDAAGKPILVHRLKSYVTAEPGTLIDEATVAERFFMRLSNHSRAHIRLVVRFVTR